MKTINITQSTDTKSVEITIDGKLSIYPATIFAVAKNNVLIISNTLDPQKIVVNPAVQVTVAGTGYANADGTANLQGAAEAINGISSIEAALEPVITPPVVPPQTS